MCITMGNNSPPIWAVWLIILSLPIVLVIANTLLFKFMKLKKLYKIIIISLSILIGLFWFMYWYVQAFFTKCL